MINFKHTFFDGVNADDDARFVGQNEALNLENIRGNVSGLSKNFELVNLPSTILKDYYRPAGTNNIIGRVMDYDSRRLILFNHNSNGKHGIYAYDLVSEFTYILLMSDQVEGGLNFSLNPDYRIARNARVISGYLHWTDNLNEPKYLSIEAAIKMNYPSYATDVDPYVSPIAYTSSTLIVRPPIYRLQVTKITDNGFLNNFIENKAYQFYYRYWYKDYRYSVLSVFSQLIPANGIDETSNAINIKMPFGEDIPEEAQQVDFCVKYGNTGETFVIRSWNKNNFYDLLAIQSHNADAVQLGLTFYDNIAGLAVDDITANTSFDNVALTAKTLEDARNRCFLGNVKKGYDTPSISSLDIALGEYNTGGAGTYTAQWKYFYLTYRNTTTGVTGTMQYYYAYNSTTTPTSFYYDAWKFSTAPPPSLNSDAATTSWATENQLAAWAQRNIAPPVGTVWISAPYNFYTTGSTLSLVFAVNLNGLQFFKSAGNYQVSIAFYDRFRRKCGVVKPAVEINIPERTFNQTVFATNIAWALNNSNALTEIPDWAYYYQIVITKNITTRFFIQIEATTSFYTLKTEDGEYQNDQTAFALNTTYATSFDISPLLNNGIGYVFQEGDYVRVCKNDDTNILLRAINQTGNFINCTPTDLGTLGAGVEFIIEIYTPYASSLTEPFFEVGDMMLVNNAGTGSRSYSILSDTINGDCYAIERDAGGSDFYFVEAMSPNDKVWSVWEQDRGWINYYDDIGQQQKETTFEWSDTFINGTKINGLNKFQVANTKDIGSSTGQLQKLQLTNKQQEDGTVLHIVSQQSNFSAYLGETQLVAAATNDALVQTSNVIGTINELKNGQGTLNPESIFEYKGLIYGISVVNASMWQYANNGMTVVSDFKFKRFFERFCLRYMELGAAAIEALCGFSYIEGAIDPSSDEVLYTLPQTEVNTVTSGIPVGFAPALPSYSTLPDYASSIQNRFDVYDGQPKTIVYKYLQNKFFGAYQWLPDCMENYGSKFFGCKSGELWLFNESLTSWNTIFGIQYPQRICFSCNLDPSIPKDIFDIAIEGNANIPNYTVLYTLLPNEQITDLTEDDYVNKEGVIYARFFRDRLSPNTSGSVIKKLKYGDDIKSVAAMVMVEFQVYDSELILNFIDIGLELSRGHLQISLK